EQALADNRTGEPIDISAQQKLFFVITHREKPHSRPLAEVHSAVEKDYRYDTAGKTLQEHGEALQAALKESREKADALAHEYNAKIEDIASTNRFTTTNPQVVQLFDTPERISIITLPDGDLMVAKLNSVKDGDIKQLPEEVRQARINEWQMQNIVSINAGMGEWLYQHAKISINEDNLKKD
ncbi:MAG: hypothetical protein Q4A74_06135, partial [Cardiobacteriaceae bacterium]|nr:hypothetical protein [Cardiobacteriaceae bacterium]